MLIKMLKFNNKMFIQYISCGGKGWLEGQVWTMTVKFWVHFLGERGEKS